METYLNNDKWDGSDTIDTEIKEANTLIKKYSKRVNNEAKTM
jgi:hypothetical protein